MFVDASADTLAPPQASPDYSNPGRLWNWLSDDKAAPKVRAPPEPLGGDGGIFFTSFLIQ